MCVFNVSVVFRYRLFRDLKDTIEVRNHRYHFTLHVSITKSDVMLLNPHRKSLQLYFRNRWNRFRAIPTQSSLNNHTIIQHVRGRAASSAPGVVATQHRQSVRVWPEDTGPSLRLVRVAVLRGTGATGSCADAWLRAAQYCVPRAGEGK